MSAAVPFFTLEPGLVRWTAAQLAVDPSAFEPVVGDMAIFRNGELAANVVYHFHLAGETGGSVQASIAAVDPRWANKTVLGALFHYPFHTLGVQRLWAQTAKHNKRARKFLLHLGFQMEGIGRRAWDGIKTDAVVYSMLPHEDRWSQHWSDVNGQRWGAEAA